jgi:8-oxoguanine deaminase
VIVRAANLWIEAREGVITATGEGNPPAGVEVLDASDCVAVPGLINCHDHIYQQATRGHASNQGLFGWLKTLYPVWAGIDAEIVRAAARFAIGRLLLSGCTLTSDHHYVFPRGEAGLLEATIEAAAELGIRFQPTRGSMSLGESRGGLPPDSLVEDEDAILADCERLIAAHHDPRPGAMCRIGIAPCSPFSVTPRLMKDSAELARKHGLRLHTHLAETADEEEFCLARFGKRPLDLMEELGWLAGDVWFAHGVHFAADEIARLGGAGAGIAHCPSSNMRLGAGACPVPELLRAGVPLGLGVDGAASNEDYHLAGEMRQALLLARTRAALAGDPEPARALQPLEVLAMATRGGAAVLGRDDVGRLEPGRRADIALFRAEDETGLVLAPPARASHVLVEGRAVVRDGRLVNADEEELARGLKQAAERLLAHA